MMDSESKNTVIEFNPVKKEDKTNAEQSKESDRSDDKESREDAKNDEMKEVESPECPEKLIEKESPATESKEPKAEQNPSEDTKSTKTISDDNKTKDEDKADDTSSEKDDLADNLKSPRRHNRTNLFLQEETDEKDGEIFSVKGQKNCQIRRHRDNVTVFPSGCMGVKDENDSVTPRRFLQPNEVKEHDAGHIDKIPKRRPVSAKPRNPLTGEGYDEKDWIRSGVNVHKKKDGNPVLGQGYTEKKPNSSKVPPGGFSHRLW